MKKNKSWSSTITITFADCAHQCENEEKYIEYVKKTFLEDYNFDLIDDEISNIKCEEVK